MNSTGDSPAAETVDRRLAFYHEALLGSSAVGSFESDPEVAGAEHCLKLFERVRKQSQGSDSDWLFSDSKSRPHSKPGADSDHTCDPDSGRINDAPQRIGRFQILRRLGEGGFGIVFEAFDPDLNRAVAVKVPRPEALISEMWRSRFLREAEAAALLNHPHLVPVYEVGHAGSLCYIVQALCQGVSLDLWLTEHDGPVPPVAAARLIQTLAEAIQHAHSRGVLHRDIKPSNILLEAAGSVGHARAGHVELRRALPARPETVGLQTKRTVDAAGGDNNNGAVESTGRVAAPAAIAADTLADIARLTDFGLARVIDEVGDQTRTGAVLGTPAYMAPEQAEGRPRDVGTASDVYALGAVLYELLTGRPPFAEATLLGTLQAVREREPKPPRRCQPGIPSDLEAVCLKCLEKDPQRRYGTAADLASDLGRFLDGEGVAARRATRWQRARRWCRRNPVPAALSAAVVLLAAVLLGASTAAALLLADAREDTLDSLESAIVARDEATQNEELALRALYEARLAQGRAERHSGQPGQRIESLRALAAAAKHAPRLGLGEHENLLLRNEAIACMSLPDLAPDIRREPEWHDRLLVETDADVELYACTEAGSRVIAVRRFEDDGIVCRLAVQGDGPHVIWHIRFSPDGCCLAARCGSGSSQTVQVWSLMSDRKPAGQNSTSGQGHTSDESGAGVREPVYVVDTMAGRSRPVDFSPDGKWLAVVRRSGNVDLLTAGTFEPVRSLNSGRAAWNVCFDPLSKRLALVRTGGIEIVEVASGRVQRSIDCRPFAYELAWSPDGGLLAGACDDNLAYIWESRTGRLETTLVGHAARVQQVAFHPAGRLIATAGDDNTTRLWSVESGRQLLRTDARLTNFSRDGRWLGAGAERLRLHSGDEPRMVNIHRATSGRMSTVDILSVDASGRLLLVSNARELLGVDLAHARVVSATQLACGWVRFDPAGKWLAAVTNNKGLCRLLFEQRETAERVICSVGPGERLAPATAGYLSVSSDGGVIAYVDRNHRPKVVVHDVHRNTSRPLQPHHTDAKFLDLAPDGRLLATGTWHGENARIWDVSSGRVVQTIPTGNAQVCFSPDGRKVVVDEGRHYTVWSVPDGKLLQAAVARSGANEPGPIAFSSDGRLLAVLGSGRRVRLLDAASFAELASFTAPGDRLIVSLCFSPDGSRLVAGTFRPGFVYIWDLHRIRKQLAEMELDWSHPPLADRSASESKPLSVKLDLAELGLAPAPSPGTWQREVEKYTVAIQARPEDADAYWRRGYSWFRLSDYEQAVRDCTRALDLDSGLQHAYFWRGRAWQHQDDCARAIADFEKSLEIKPKDGWCCRHLAWLYSAGPEELRNPERALVLARKGLQLIPKQATDSMPIFLSTLGAAYYRNGRLEEALDALSRSVHTSPAALSATTLLFEAMCHQDAGHPAEARHCYDRAMETQDVHPQPLDRFDAIQREAAALLGVE